MIMGGIRLVAFLRRFYYILVPSRPVSPRVHTYTSAHTRVHYSINILPSQELETSQELKASTIVMPVSTKFIKR